MSEWKELWLQNYKGQGDTAELEKHLKTLGYGSRLNVTYLPWAVVERIFRLQGGTVEWLPVLDGTYVDVDSAVVGREHKEENGIAMADNVVINSYFVNVHTKWQGQSYTERYPLQDSNGKPLTRWTQNDLNKAYQRGKVKAIAIVSGIGYKLFEDGDLQFEVEDTVIQTKPPKETPQKETPKQPEKLLIKPETETRADKEQDIKREYLNGEEKAQTIKKYLVEKNVTKIGDLSDDDLDKLYAIIV